MFNNTFIHYANKVVVTPQQHKDENGQTLPKIKIEIFGKYKDVSFVQEFTVFSDKQLDLVVHDNPVTEN